MEERRRTVLSGLERLFMTNRSRRSPTNIPPPDTKGFSLLLESQARLPLEIQQEILLHLPLSSFWASRSVCRSWAAFIEGFVFRSFFVNEKVTLVQTWYGRQSCLPEHRTPVPVYELPLARVEDNRWLVFPLLATERDDSQMYELVTERAQANPDAPPVPRLVKQGCHVVHRRLRRIKIYFPLVQYTLRMRIFRTTAGTEWDVKPPRLRFEGESWEVWVDWRALIGAVIRQDKRGLDDVRTLVLAQLCKGGDLLLSG